MILGHVTFWKLDTLTDTFGLNVCPGYDVKLHPVTMAQLSTVEVLVEMLVNRWEFRIALCLAGGNASATCLKMQVMRFADVQ